MQLFYGMHGIWNLFGYQVWYYFITRVYISMHWDPKSFSPRFVFLTLLDVFDGVLFFVYFIEGICFHTNEGFFGSKDEHNRDCIICTMSVLLFTTASNLFWKTISHREILTENTSLSILCNTLNTERGFVLVKEHEWVHGYYRCFHCTNVCVYLCTWAFRIGVCTRVCGGIRLTGWESLSILGCRNLFHSLQG